ncbi:MAG: hypothetical protein IT430_10105 [Phycisphaerales bacterium]|nr:hypothetical protein [Phycisphaerales bacterium]
MKRASTELHRAHCSLAPARRRRGIAMMLVVFCLAAASIMAAAYIASRENAPQLSSNVASGSTARMAASAGLQMARAIFECEDADFRDTMVNGVLIDSEPVGNATVTVKVTALDGTPVAPGTQYFHITATGSCNGMTQIAEARAHVELDDAAPMPTFADFALFGGSTVQVTDSVVTRWAASPDARWGAPLWLGTNNIAGGEVLVSGSAHVLDGCVHVDSDGGASVVSDASSDGSDLRIRSLAANLTLPLLNPPPANTSMCSPSPTPNVNITSNTVLSNDSWILSSVRIADSGVVRVNSGSLVTRRVTGNVTIENGGRMLVETDHDFVIDGNLTIRNGSTINVSPGVRCRIWVSGSLTVDDAAIGLSLAQAATVSDIERGLEAYKNPAECQIYQGSLTNHQTWRFQNGSIAVARIYAPNADVSIATGSCLMGALLAKQARVLSSSVLHYDPRLDNRGGYTNTEGPLYNDDGTLNTVLLATVTNISDASLASLAAALNIPLPLPLLGVNDPSPRNRLVEWTLLRTGIEPAGDQTDTASADVEG